MKVNGISSVNYLIFSAKNDKKNNNAEGSSSAHINRKKLLYATLGALAVAGTVAIIVNKARKGKMPIDIPAPDLKPHKPEPPKTEQLKPVDIKVIQEKPEFSPEALEQRAVNGPIKDDAWSFDDMKKYYEKLDAKGKKQVEAIVEQTRQNLHGSKPEFSPEALEQRAINGAVKQDTWSPEDMKAYYGNDCARVRKSTSYTSYKYVSEDDKPLYEKRVYNALSDYGEGAVEIRKTNKNGSVISEITSADGKLIKTQISNPAVNYSVAKFFENGKLSKIVSDTSAGHTETIFADGIKSSVHMRKDGSEVFKIYEKDEKGRYNCVYRMTNNENAKWSHEFDTKSVEYINNGKYSKTEAYYKPECDADGNVIEKYSNQELLCNSEDNAVYTAKSTLIRDRKGNIIDESKVTKPRKPKGPDGADAGKQLASWYKDYLELCKKYGVSPRPCGVKGGAGDHYFELCLRRNNKEAYERYLRLQEYRARYDEKAMLEQVLRIGDNKSLALSPEKLAKLSKNELQMLLAYIEKGYIKADSLENLSSNKIKELIVKAQEQERIAQEARIAEQRLEEQRLLELEQQENYNRAQEPEILVYA